MIETIIILFAGLVFVYVIHTFVSIKQKQIEYALREYKPHKGGRKG